MLIPHSNANPAMERSRLAGEEKTHYKLRLHMHFSLSAGCSRSILIARKSRGAGGAGVRHHKRGDGSQPAAERFLTLAVTLACTRRDFATDTASTQS